MLWFTEKRVLRNNLSLCLLEEREKLGGHICNSFRYHPIVAEGPSLRPLVSFYGSNFFNLSISVKEHHHSCTEFSQSLVGKIWIYRISTYTQWNAVFMYYFNSTNVLLVI